MSTKYDGGFMDRAHAAERAYVDSMTEAERKEYFREKDRCDLNKIFLALADMGELP